VRSGKKVSGSLSQRAEWPNNEMRRGAVFGNRSFSPADAAVGIEFDKLTSGDLALSSFLAAAKNGLSSTCIFTRTQNKATHVWNWMDFFVYGKGTRPVGIRRRQRQADGRKMERELTREREEKGKALEGPVHHRRASSTLFFSPHCENTSARFYVF